MVAYAIDQMTLYISIEYITFLREALPETL